MSDTVAHILIYVVLGSHFVFVFLLLAFIGRHSWGRGVLTFLGQYARQLAFLVALIAMTGSLFYSEIIGFEPCLLCWWQRIFLYPLVFIFGVAVWKKNDAAFLYATPLALISVIISSYHQYVYLGGQSLLPCTALGGACSKVYVFAFSYITIPMMSLTIALYILLLAQFDKVYKYENHHS
jgi:disulfide bond formation protein DsbB